MIYLFLKRCAAAALVLCAAMLVSGCTTIINWDESLSPEKSALVVFSDAIHVLSYNGISVEDAWYPARRYRTNKVTLPAGEMSLVFDLKYVTGSNYHTRIFSGKNIELRFNLEAGKEYTLGPYRKTEGFIIEKGEFGAAIWSFAASGGMPGIFDENKIIKTWKLGEF
jgi:hypothetical protein